MQVRLARCDWFAAAAARARRSSPRVQRTRAMPEVPWHVPISADPAIVGRISMLSHNGRVAVPLMVLNSREGYEQSLP